MARETIIDLFWERVEHCPDRPAIFYKVHGEYKSIIWREYGRLVSQVSAGLLKCGVQAQDKVAIMSGTRPQWVWADMGILNIDSVSVPIYPTLSKHEVYDLLLHSDSVGVFVESAEQLSKILELDSMPELLRFAVVFNGTVPSSREKLKILSLEDFLHEGDLYGLAHQSELSERRSQITPETVATIVYTSGTTGIPKGVVIPHSNIYFVCRAMSHTIGFHADDLTLSYLPLSHILERIGGEFLPIYDGLMVAYAESMDTVAQNLLEVHPTIMGAVPRVFEKIYSRITTEIRRLPKPLQYLVQLALSAGLKVQEMKDSGKSTQNILLQTICKGEFQIADKLVFSRIRKRLGGRLRFIASGAAPLSLDLQMFFSSIGIPVVEGYGLTETCAPLCANVPKSIKLGTVGRALPGIEIKIAYDGEILARGPSIFSSYYKNAAATREAFIDGWFATGDIGELDSAGYLTIKDRKKDIIVTSGGKKVAPQYLENLFAGEPLISHVLVYGERRNYITALITLNEDGLRAFAAKHGILYVNPEELMSDPLVLKYIQRVVHRKNRKLATFEQIKKFLILDKDFTIEAGELTPTFKIKRQLVTGKYRNLLDTLYENEDHGEVAGVAAPLKQLDIAKN